MPVRHLGPKANRRDFLRGVISMAAAAVAAPALTGCRRDEDIEWNEEADVLIVGAGGAGLTAAIEAIRGGASVLLFEKAEEAGGSTALSAGLIQGSGTAVQTDLGITNDTAEKHFQYYTQAGEGIPTPELLRTLTDGSADAVAAMQDLGQTYATVVPLGPLPTVDDEYLVPRIHYPGPEAGGGGVGHVAVLLAELDALGGEVRANAEVTGLIEDPDEGIVGVTVTIGARTLNVRARRAVVLASGGFDWNTELCRAFSPQQLWELDTGSCLCAPTNTGDGLVMGMAVGADLAGMGGTIGFPAINVGRSVPGVWVNVHGQRFVNEEAHYSYAVRAVFDQEAHVAWAIFDQGVADLGGAAIGNPLGIAWSEDLSAEIASGKILTADTLEDLAAATGIVHHELARTIAQWNADSEQDPLFGRLVGLAPLQTAPYYATRVVSANLGTMGGLRIDTKTRVIDLQGQPIKRLYAAGMVAGGFLGPYYPGSGTAVLSTVVFGRIAGENAAAETALKPVKKLVEV